MGIVLDLILIICLALSIFFGYKKGLIGVAFNLCAFLVAIIVTWILYNPVTNLVINNTEIDDGIKNAIIEKCVIKQEENDEKKQEENKVNEYIEQYIKAPVTNTTNSVIEETAKTISEKLVAIGVAIVLFIVVRMALILLKFVAEAIAKLPIIKQCNKAGGLVYGAIRGMFIIYVFLAILFLVMSLNNSGTIANMINSSIISKVLYENNLLLNIVFK